MRRSCNRAATPKVSVERRTSAACSDIDPTGGKGDFPLAAVEVLAHDDDLAWGSTDTPSLLIIDEAHQIARWAASDSRSERTRYKHYVGLTQSTRLVLLLSATPSLHSDGVFLALLHLLDPELHDLDDLEGFRSKMELREDLASALLSFVRRAKLFNSFQIAKKYVYRLLQRRLARDDSSKFGEALCHQIGGSSGSTERRADARSSRSSIFERNPSRSSKSCSSGSNRYAGVRGTPRHRAETELPRAGAQDVLTG